MKGHTDLKVVHSRKLVRGGVSLNQTVNFVCVALSIRTQVFCVSTYQKYSGLLSYKEKNKINSNIIFVIVQEGFQRNVWANVSVSVVRGQMNSGGSMLSWNVSTPCRLEAEVWLCQRDAGVGGCREQGSSRQPLSNGPWMENRKGLWVTSDHSTFVVLFC